MWIAGICGWRLHGNAQGSNVVQSRNVPDSAASVRASAERSAVDDALVEGEVTDTAVAVTWAVLVMELDANTVLIGTCGILVVSIPGTIPFRRKSHVPARDGTIGIGHGKNERSDAGFGSPLPRPVLCCAH